MYERHEFEQLPYDCCVWLSADGARYIRVEIQFTASVERKSAEVSWPKLRAKIETTPVEPAGNHVPPSNLLPAAPASSLPASFEFVGKIWGSAVLNPNYTFECFVDGSNTRFAVAAARAVADNLSRSYNPLFLYGAVGMGKTHLMQAIGNDIRKLAPEKSIVYVSAEMFAQELINSLRNDRAIAFRETLRNVDLLLVDDIQFLAGKERTQEEFFHLFNDLYGREKQIVIASDRSPKDLEAIEERLRSRFDWGLIADIQPADFETKLAIIQKKAELQRIDVPKDVASYIAANTRSNIRDLEGALTRLAAHSMITGQPITLLYAQQVLAGIVQPLAKGVSIESVQKYVAKEFGLRVQDLTRKKKTAGSTLPRQVAMYLAKELTSAPLNEIGASFGGRHASTVFYSATRIAKQRSSDKGLKRLLDRAAEELRS